MFKIAGAIAKQPNGRYCRYSSVVESITHFNMTKEDYLSNVTCSTKNREDALDTLENHIYDFEYVVSLISTFNTTEEEKEYLIKKMTDTYDGKYESF